MNDIEQNFQMRYIIDSPDYYLGNELAKVGNKIHFSSKKYIKEILRRYQKKCEDIKKEVIPVKFK